MNVDLNKTDLIRLIKGTQPDYAQMDELNAYGQYWEGSTQAWVWSEHALSTLSEEDMWHVYKIVSKPPTQSNYSKYEDQQRKDKLKEIAEVQAVLEDGIIRDNQWQIDAARKEIERLRGEL